MYVFIFSALSIFALGFVFLKGTSKVVYVKKLMLPAVCLLFIASLIIFSKAAVNAAAKGLDLWLKIVFPSLFPFFVASELLNGTGFIRAMGVLLEPVMRPLFNVPGCGSFAFLMGITSGYPVGAKITAGMRKENLLTKSEAERLLAFSNNSGPLFIVGAVAVGMFKIPQIGPLLLICHIAACITVGIIFGLLSSDRTALSAIHRQRIFRRLKTELLISAKGRCINFGTAFGDAVKNSVMTLLMIGGFIIFFSVVITLLLKAEIIQAIANAFALVLSPLGIGKEIIASLLSGFFEITTGSNMAGSVQAASLSQKLAAASIIIGWAGLSVHSQVLSIVSRTDLSMRPYLLGKLLQGIFAGIYTWIGLKTAGHFFLKSDPVFFQVNNLHTLHWHRYLLVSCAYLAAALMILVVLAVIVQAFKYLSNGKSIAGKNLYR